MASITSSGIGSGLDVNGLVTQLLTLESKPLAALNVKETGYQAKLSAYGTLKSAVSTFQSTMKGLSSLARFQGVTASSADGALYTASASSSAAPGSYAVEVQQLAQAHKIASTAFTNVTDAVGSGALTIQFGTFSGGTFTANASKATQTVTIDSAHASLGGVRDAINAAKVGVTATILNDGTGNRLVVGAVAITALETGSSLASPLVKLCVLVGAPILILTTGDASLRIWRSAWACLCTTRSPSACCP